MVAQHHPGGAGIHHRLDDLQDAELLGSTVDQIADEDRLAARMPERAVPRPLVAHGEQQVHQGGCTSMDIPDDVEATRITLQHRHFPFAESRERERSCQTPIGVGRFVIRATHERGVGAPPSRSLATVSREAPSF